MCFLKTGFFLLSLFVYQQLSALCTSVQSGDWNDPATWSCSGGPGCGDTIVIAAGHTVSIRTHQDFSEPGCATPMFVVVDGTLDFPVNGPKLRLPCNSGFIINSGGMLSASAPAGGGSANFLEICNTVYWRKADGPLTGPVEFGAPLPVDLLFFDANVIEKTVHLSWVTATEINNDYFTLEKSVDAKNWEVVTYTQGAGNSNQLINYLEVDYQPYEGISYYRLKQTDFDGSYKYFDIVPVKMVNPDSVDIAVYPNPVEHLQTVTVEHSFNNNQEVLVVLRDIQGKEFYSKVHLSSSNNKLIGIPIDYQIPSGVYFVIATSENKIFSKKLIIN